MVVVALPVRGVILGQFAGAYRVPKASHTTDEPAGIFPSGCIHRVVQQVIRQPDRPVGIVAQRILVIRRVPCERLLAGAGEGGGKPLEEQHMVERLAAPLGCGDEDLEGSEEAILLYNQKVMINQSRNAFRDSGNMTRQRDLFGIHPIAKKTLGRWRYPYR